MTGTEKPLGNAVAADRRGICGPCHNLQSNTSVQNVLAMGDAAWGGMCHDLGGASALRGYISDATRPPLGGGVTHGV